MEQDNDRWTAIKGKKSRKGRVISKGKGQDRKRKDMLCEEVRYGFSSTPKTSLVLLCYDSGTSILAKLHRSFSEKYLSSTDGSFSCKWGFTPVIGRMLVDKALMV